MSDIDFSSLPNKKYYSISEVSSLLRIKQTEIRYWEKFVPKLRSDKSIRIYDLKKIGILKKVKVLIKDQGIKPSYIDNYMKEKNSKKTTSLECRHSQ